MPVAYRASYRAISDPEQVLIQPSPSSAMPTRPGSRAAHRSP